MGTNSEVNGVCLSQDFNIEVLVVTSVFRLFGVTYSVNRKLPVKTSEIVPDTYRPD